MTTIFCSKKLEGFLNNSDPYLEPDYGNKFGNWNAHTFLIERKRFILFTNDRTTYSIVFIDIRKADLKDFDHLFRESLIRQLDNDVRINERQEIELRNSLTDIRLTRTNNNKRVLGTMNEFVHIIKYFVANEGGPAHISAMELGYRINNQLVKAPLEVTSEKYSVPKELMLQLLQKNTSL
ncbi:hypothetical protein [Chryseolinea sp. H1M3-3]|uniref:DUF6933 domain-containing protein n=1 Tax=Chryseolinea sp. H1M3-3 TaxID=3034144 RepID=UPI0023EA9211|nr:hypothetical protein [Chryseolinea sp. H1M3-3]